MEDSLLAVSAILMPFVFKVIQVLKDKKLQDKKMDKEYKNFKQRKSIEKQTYSLYLFFAATTLFIP